MAKKLFVVYDDNGQRIEIKSASKVSNDFYYDPSKTFYRIYEGEGDDAVEITNCIHGARCGQAEAEKFHWPEEILRLLNWAGQGDDELEDLSEDEFKILGQCGFKCVMNDFNTVIRL